MKKKKTSTSLTGTYVIEHVTKLLKKEETHAQRNSRLNKYRHF